MSEKPPRAMSLDQLDGPVLLVEDNAIVAIDTEENLLDLGIKEVKLAYDVEQAEEIIKTTRLSAAILDYNLPDGTSTTLADQLKQKGVPFIFATGVADPESLPDRFISHTLLVKPFTEVDICNALSSLVGLTSSVEPTTE